MACEGWFQAASSIPRTRAQSQSDPKLCLATPSVRRPSPDPQRLTLINPPHRYSYHHIVSIVIPALPTSPPPNNMKILESQSAVLSNYEVHAHLAANRAKPRTTPQKHTNVDTVLKEVTPSPLNPLFFTKSYSQSLFSPANRLSLPDPHLPLPHPALPKPPLQRRRPPRPGRRLAAVQADEERSADDCEPEAG